MAHWGEALERADAYVAATEDPTHCPTTGTQRTIDFAVESWIEAVVVDHGIESAPPKAVRISVVADPKNHSIETMSGQRPFPKTVPIGCARQPVIPSWFLDSSNDP